MKRFLVYYVCAALFLFIGQSVSGQNNLQFNKPIIETITLPSGTYVTRSITVPAGKVWKIEHASLINDDATPNDVSYNQINTTSALLIDAMGLLPVYSGGTATPSVSKLPIWLPAGTYSYRLYYNGSASYPLVGTFNGIEFNLVP